jgi:hypothetical protein
MRQASEVVLGHAIPVDSKVTYYPGHYRDERGEEMYAKVTSLLAELEQAHGKGGEPPS